MELKTVTIPVTADTNVVLGQAHFIRTAEDLAELMATAAPQARYGLAFNEASGPCLVRVEGNDATLREQAVGYARDIGAGHVFVLLMRQAYPIQVLDRIKQCLEVCQVFCATGNPVEVVVAETPHGRGVLGVIDGEAPKGVEAPEDVASRRRLLRTLGYKL